MSREVFRSSVYTNRPAYADYDAPEKFQAIQGIIITRLKQHPNAICSYSGGADSDIMLDLIERTRSIFPTKANILLLEQELDELILRSSAHDGAGRSNAVSDSVAQIVLQREKMRKRINLLTAQKNAVEAYLTACDDYYGLILRWHYVEGKTWTSIAMTVGGNNTEDGIRKACHRYVTKNP